jgi:hypothetical protein
MSYIIATVIVLLAIAMFLLRRAGLVRGRPLSPLAAVSFALIVAAIAFGDGRLLPYALIGLGVSLAVLDALLQYRS